jgi:hypothetical protein
VQIVIEEALRPLAQSCLRKKAKEKAKKKEKKKEYQKPRDGRA